MLTNKIFTAIFLCIGSIFACSAAIANESAIYFDFNSIPSYQLTDKINMRFITSSKFTVIQWNLKAGAKLLPAHSHSNEQVTRILEGDIDVQTNDTLYHLHTGDTMVFPQM